MDPHCIEEKARKYYGETDIFEFAGYLLPDGTMLNFSYEGYQRDEDHRNIGQFFRKADGWFAIVAFLRRGNIRVSCNSNGYRFEYIQEPTEKQKIMLEQAERIAFRNGIEFCIEKSDWNGISEKHFFETWELDAA